MPKAKELRPYVEQLITVAKRGVAAGGTGVLHARRLVAADIADADVAKKLFDTLAPRFAGRPGGYVRIIKAGFRRGDSADVARIELVGSEFDPKKAEAEKEAKAGEKGGRGPRRAESAGRPSASAAGRPTTPRAAARRTSTPRPWPSPRPSRATPAAAARGASAPGGRSPRPHGPGGRSCQGRSIDAPGGPGTPPPGRGWT